VKKKMEMKKMKIYNIKNKNVEDEYNVKNIIE
jgi:PII-like signaling protein